MGRFDQSYFILPKLLVLLNLICSEYAGSINCGDNGCAGDEMNCLVDGNACTLSCAVNGCNGATLNCAGGLDCNVILSGDNAGYNMIINGRNATRLEITTGSGFATQLKIANIFCPINANCVIRCIGDGSTTNTCEQTQIHGESATTLRLECGNTNNVCDMSHIWCPDNGSCQLSGQPDTSAMTNMQIYSIQGFKTITVENGNTAISLGILLCTPDYNEFCYIDANPPAVAGNSNNVCESYPNICDNPTAAPTISPTTSTPTTSIPTAYPTTSIPTTSNPTTIPTKSPTKYPSKSPSNNPTFSSKNPTITPSLYPTKHPTLNPTHSPTDENAGEIKDTESGDDENNDEQANANRNKNETVMFIVIIVGVVFVCILIGFIFWMINRNKKRKHRTQIDNIMTDKTNETGQAVVELEQLEMKQVQTDGNIIDDNINNETAKDDENNDDSLYNSANDVITPIGSITTKDADDVNENLNANNNDENEEDELYENYSTPFTPVGHVQETLGNETIGSYDENNLMDANKTNEGGM